MHRREPHEILFAFFRPEPLLELDDARPDLLRAPPRGRALLNAERVHEIRKVVHEADKLVVCPVRRERGDGVRGRACVRGLGRERAREQPRVEICLWGMRSKNK